MPSDLTPAKLRELIAAATPGPWQHKIDTSWPTKDRIIDSPSQVIVRDEDCYKHYKCNRGDDRNFDLIVYLFNNAPALADALEKAELLEWLWQEAHEGIVEIGMLEYGGPVGLLDRLGRRHIGNTALTALRAAKEAADGNL